MVEPKKGTKWPKNLPRFENRQDAIAVCKELCKNQFLLRSEKLGKGELGVRGLFFKEVAHERSLTCCSLSLLDDQSPRL